MFLLANLDSVITGDVIVGAFFTLLVVIVVMFFQNIPISEHRRQIDRQLEYNDTFAEHLGSCFSDEVAQAMVELSKRTMRLTEAAAENRRRSYTGDSRSQILHQKHASALAAVKKQRAVVAGLLEKWKKQEAEVGV